MHGGEKLLGPKLAGTKSLLQKLKNEIYCEVYTNDPSNYTKKKKRKTLKWMKIGLHHFPLGEKDTKYKMFPLVSVQVWHGEPGNMHPYNFEA